MQVSSGKIAEQAHMADTSSHLPELILSVIAYNEYSEEMDIMHFKNLLHEREWRHIALPNADS